MEKQIERANSINGRERGRTLAGLSIAFFYTIAEMENGKKFRTITARAEDNPAVSRIPNLRYFPAIGIHATG